MLVRATAEQTLCESVNIKCKKIPQATSMLLHAIQENENKYIQNSLKVTFHMVNIILLNELKYKFRKLHYYIANTITKNVNWNSAYIYNICYIYKEF